MAAITTKARNALPAKEFAGPDRSYPIDTANRARNALARGAQNASPALQATIRRKVAAKYPGIEVSGKKDNPGNHNSNSKPPANSNSRSAAAAKPRASQPGAGGNTYRSSNPPPTKGFVTSGKGAGNGGGGAKPPARAASTNTRLAKELDRRLDMRSSGRK